MCVAQSLTCHSLSEVAPSQPPAPPASPPPLDNDVTTSTQPPAEHTATPPPDAPAAGENAAIFIEQLFDFGQSESDLESDAQSASGDQSEASLCEVEGHENVPDVIAPLEEKPTFSDGFYSSDDEKSGNQFHTIEMIY